MSALLQAFLQKLVKSGALEVEFSDGRRCVVGDGSPATCAMIIADRGAESALALDPEMTLGDLYMNGRIEMIRGEIYDLLALAAMNKRSCGCGKARDKVLARRRNRCRPQC
jgi:cyclopropane-fatty-acyl-phospholipid synthase